jgi:hypothetical protein
VLKLPSEVEQRHPEDDAEPEDSRHIAVCDGLADGDGHDHREEDVDRQRVEEPKDRPAETATLMHPEQFTAV